jgi:hypothetical protein
MALNLSIEPLSATVPDMVMLPATDVVELDNLLANLLERFSQHQRLVRHLSLGWGFSTPQDFNGDIALIACFASSWTPAMVRRWHADPFGYLRPWNEVPCAHGERATRHAALDRHRRGHLLDGVASNGLLPQQAASWAGTLQAGRLSSWRWNDCALERLPEFDAESAELEPVPDDEEDGPPVLVELVRAKISERRQALAGHVD